MELQPCPFPAPRGEPQWSAAGGGVAPAYPALSSQHTPGQVKGQVTGPLGPWGYVAAAFLLPSSPAGHKGPPRETEAGQTAKPPGRENSAPPLRLHPPGTDRPVNFQRQGEALSEFSKERHGFNQCILRRGGGRHACGVSRTDGHWDTMEFHKPGASCALSATGCK